MSQYIIPQNPDKDEEDGEIKRKGKGKKKKRTWLLLDTEEEKVYYRYMGEHSQRQAQGHLGQFRGDMTRLFGPVGREKGEKKREEPDAATRRPKIQKGRVTKYLDSIRAFGGRADSSALNSGWRKGFAAIP